MSSFKIGQQVVDIVSGRGVITDIVMGDLYPVKVAMPPHSDTTSRSYSLDGKANVTDVNKSLYPLGTIFTKPVTPQVIEKEFKDGQLVMVRQNSRYIWSMFIYKEMRLKEGKYVHVVYDYDYKVQEGLYFHECRSLTGEEKEALAKALTVSYRSD